jgi:hypothetical protein
LEDFIGLGELKMILACRSFSVRYVAIGIAISFALLFCAADTAAQASRVGATLEGMVRDTSGAVILNSKVTLKNPLTNQPRTVTTGQQGFFRAEQLSVGTYEVRVEQTGFAPYRQAGVVASLGQTVHLDIVLAPASASEQVTVNGQLSSLDASQSSVVSSVDQERIEELPVRSRNYLDFVLLAPGVSSSPTHAAAQKERVALQDLAKDDWILFARRVHPFVHDAIMETAQREGIVPKYAHDIITTQQAVHLVAEHVGVAILTKPTAVGFSSEGVVIKPLSDTSLCFESCVIMRTDDDSRLANEFARSFLRRYEPQSLPPKQMELSLSA